MNSICKFIPSNGSVGTLKTVHFVYETEWKKLKQPMIQPIYYLFLVVRGEGTLRFPEFDTHTIGVGSLFLVPPGVRYEITGSDDLCYMYISFMGTRAIEIIDALRISPPHNVRHGFHEHIPFWKTEIQRLTPQNANMIAESTLLHTLSYLTAEHSERESAKGTDILEAITGYVDNNFRDANLTLKKLADIFSYSDKYLSSLFKSRTGITWSVYLNRLRIQHATEQIEGGEKSISAIAIACGYNDPMYFSKVFKRFTGKAPRDYLKQYEKSQ